MDKLYFCFLNIKIILIALTTLINLILNAIESNCLKVTNEASTGYILLNDENIKAKFI